MNKILAARESSVVRRALCMIHGTAGAMPSIGTLCDRLCVSRGHFSRLFRQEIGISPGSYILEVKLKRSCRVMAREPDLTIEQVARKVGYSSAATLIRPFKRRYGQTPHEWRMRRAG